MKLFSTSQIKACDAYTIQATQITTLDLIERAALRCSSYIQLHYPLDTPFVILCGVGHNGADGLALARILIEHGYGVKVFLLEHSTSISPENKTNQNKLIRMNASLIDFISEGAMISDVPSQVVIIDAILGIGINRGLSGWMADFITQINQLKNHKIAIDTPTGLPADSLPSKDQVVFKADTTLSFHLYKRSFLHPEGAAYCGHVELLDIGLSPVFIESTTTHYKTISIDFVKSKIISKKAYSHKYNNGYVQLIGGSTGKSGAIILATQAALRSGVGMVSTLVPEDCYTPIQAQAFEAMCATSGKAHITKINIPNKVQAVAIGMGMGTNDATAQAFENFIDNTNIPCVLDADALNLLAKHEDMMHKVPQNSILTPHTGENDRLFGVSQNSLQRVEQVRNMAMKYKLCIILKGHRTVIAVPSGDCYYNTNGNAGMAKGGSGDILAGLLAGLLAQGYKAEDAAIISVFLHGLAGDLAAQHEGQMGMRASSIINHLPQAWQTLLKS